MEKIFKEKEYNKLLKKENKEDLIVIEDNNQYIVIEKKELEDKINDITTKFFEILDIKVEIAISILEEIVEIKLQTDNNAFVIGKNGKNINRFINILKDLYEFNTSKKIIFKIDIDNYNVKKELELKEYISIILEELDKTNNPVVLSGLNSYERRIIHNEVSKTNDYKSMSFDEDNTRKLKISKK